ncbi:acyl-CoA dehydrogenase [Brucella anthropi]|uniref:acyl-CoA dehydrogenase family protein n=1 Tax=Brucella anthropi TaxID=529 RepID=UPI003987ACB1
MNRSVENEKTRTVAMDDVLAEIRARRDEFEKLTYVPRDMVDRLKAVGAYRAFVPKALGGDELGPAEFCALIETLSAADASTGWVASFGVSAVYLGALPRATYETIFGTDPDTVFAGSIFPPQVANQVEGGFEVQGRWPYCSGCMGAQLIGAGIRVEGGSTSSLPRMAVMPREKISIKHTWDVIGLTGTGSHDIVADCVVVPEEWTFIRGGEAQRDEAIFRYPSMALASQVLAVVALGTAREALDWLHREAREKPAITGAPPIGARPHIQADLGRAEARLRSARCFFYDAIHEAWEQVKAGDPVEREAHIRLRLSSTEAAHAGAEVARMAFVMTGTEALRRGHPVSRCMLDAAAVAQHAFLGIGTWTLAGAASLGQPVAPGYP